MRSMILGFLMALAPLTSSAGVATTFFSTSAFNSDSTAMDATLGLTGYKVESFESLTLMPGLSIVVSGDVPTTTFAGALPNLFDQAPCGFTSANSMWDGTRGVINSPTNTLDSCFVPTNISSALTVNYSPGTSSIGIGMGNFQSLTSPQFPISDHELIVNGQSLGLLESLAGGNWTPGLSRNGYLRVDGTGGTTITSIEFRNLTGRDVLILDHIAVAGVTSIPEPSGIALATLALCIVGWARRAIRLQ